MVALSTSVSRTIVDYWNAARPPDQGLPGVDRLDPLSLPPPLLPYIFVVGLTHLPEFTATIRLQGAYVVDRVGQKLAGCAIDEANFGPNYAAILETYRMVARERRPYATHERLASAGPHHMSIEVVHLPFAGPDGAVAKVMGTISHLAVDRKPPDAFEPVVWHLLQRFEIEPAPRRRAAGD